MKKFIFLIVSICFFVNIDAFSQEKPGFTRKARRKAPENKSETSRPVNSGTTSSARSLSTETLFLTLQVTTDLEGTLWAGNKSYPLVPGEKVKIPIYQDKANFKFEGPGGFVKDLKEEFAPSQKGSVVDWSPPSLAESYRVFLQQQEKKSRIELALDGIFHHMLAIEGDPKGKPMKRFEISRCEVTVRQFAAFAEQSEKFAKDGGGLDSAFVLLKGSRGERGFMPGVNWKHDPFGRVRPEEEYHHPVVNVSWYEAMAFCEWLSKDLLYNYRLPTIAEWEYAAGGGDYQYQYPWGDDLVIDSLPGNTADISLKEMLPQRKAEVSEVPDGYPLTSPVRSFAPGSFGLYDMGGNVAEWTLDDHYRRGLADQTVLEKVVKGGSYFVLPENCKVMERYGIPPERRHCGVGFRVVREPK